MNPSRTRTGPRPCSHHWGCGRLAMVYWLARVGLNLIAALARMYPLLGASLVLLVVYLGAKQAGLSWLPGHL